MTILDASVARPLEGGPSFSLKNRLVRLVWNLTWAALASWTPPPLHRWRALLLRAFGADVHPTVAVYGKAKIWLPSNLKAGRHVRIGPGANVYCQAPIEIGDYTIVSQGAHLCAGTHDVDDPNFQLVVDPIRIGARAWIAAEAFVGPGVRVGEGAVLGARGVAFKDLGAFEIWAGNPAKKIRMRRIPGALADDDATRTT